MNLTAEGRDRAQRLAGDPNQRRELTFYCEFCGTANEITITLETLKALLQRISSDDPKLQKAIDDAKRGDYRSAIDEARRRFGF